MSGLLYWDQKVPRGLSFSKHVDLYDKDGDYEIHFFQIIGPLQDKTKEEYICALLGYLLTYLLPTSLLLIYYLLICLLLTYLLPYYLLNTHLLPAYLLITHLLLTYFIITYYLLT